MKKAGEPSEWFTHRDILSYKPSERLDQERNLERVKQEEVLKETFSRYKLKEMRIDK